MTTEAPQARPWLKQGAQALAVHTGESSSRRQWVEQVTINTIDGSTVVTDDYAEYSLETLQSIEGAHFASAAVLVPLDDPESRTMLFLEDQRKAHEEVVNAEVAVARKPGSTVARRRLAAAIAAEESVRLAFGDFMTGKSGE